MYLIQFNVSTSPDEQFDYYPAALMFFDPDPASENVFNKTKNQQILSQFFFEFYSRFIEKQEWPNSSNFTKEDWISNATQVLSFYETLWFKNYKESGYFDNTWRELTMIPLTTNQANSLPKASYLD